MERPLLESAVRKWKSEINEIIYKLGITAFVETGTQYGSTTMYIASKHVDLPIYTCEIDQTSYEIAKKNLHVYPNVKAHLGSSEKFIASLISEGVLGEFPMFFLES
jgi:predicted O-methyltransferase YrrM